MTRVDEFVTDPADADGVVLLGDPTVERMAGHLIDHYLQVGAGTVQRSP